ncbi:MAG: chemotaxis protein CheW, partial [Planctomycetota bacterium]
EILKVREIIGIMGITPVPQTPKFIKGVINLRGKVIPVVDLRLKFGFDEVDYTKETCIIVVEVKSVLTGIIVDTVSEVLDITNEELETTPNLGEDVNTDIFIGVAKIKDKVKILLDLDKILGAEEINLVESLSAIR